MNKIICKNDAKAERNGFSLQKERDRKLVVILKCYSTEFRVPFYELLKVKLAEQNVELLVISGQPSKYEKGFKTQLSSCEITIHNKYIYLGKNYLVWQPALAHCFKANLVIVQQGTRNLINYPLMLLRGISRYKLAYWGHGRNFQADRANKFSEWLKRKYSTHVDHWFAYNDRSADVVRRLGFPDNKITSVNNAVDTTENRRFLESITPEEKQIFRKRYGVADKAPVGILCSRLYAGKRLGFLLAILELLKKELTDFHFFVVGDGLEAPMIQDFERRNGEWFHWLGALYGRAKAEVFSIADIHLLPGAVGLNIVDCFSLLTPIVTVELDTHGPEISYLAHGVNGVMTENSEDAFASAVCKLFRDRAALECLIQGCAVAREKYTIEAMVDRFADGICKELL